MSNITPNQMPLNEDDPLTDFKARDVELLGKVKTVHVSGSGPAVIVMHEMPGISPQVARFARWVRDAGFTVFMPSLFGRDGAVPQADGWPVRENGPLPGSDIFPVSKWML